MNALVTLAAAVAILAVLVLMARGPLGAVRQDRDLAAEERGWLEAQRFPATVERVYQHPRLLITDGPRLHELGYVLVEQRRVRLGWSRAHVAVWRAEAPPAAPAPAGRYDVLPSPRPTMTEDQACRPPTAEPRPAGPVTSPAAPGTSAPRAEPSRSFPSAGAAGPSASRAAPAPRS